MNAYLQKKANFYCLNLNLENMKSLQVNKFGSNQKLYTINLLNNCNSLILKLKNKF